MRILKLGTILIITCALVFAIIVGAGAEGRDCKNRWALSYSYELPPDFWSSGTHEYEFEIVLDGATINFPQSFDVAEDSDLYKKQVFLRVLGLSSPEGYIEEINISQDTVFQVTFDIPGTRQEAEETASETAAKIRWDGQDWIELSAGPLANWCSWPNAGHFKRTWAPILK